MKNGMPSILVIVQWFGEWPAWNRYFLESCRWNPSIDWLIVTDCGDLIDQPPNVRLLRTSLQDYRDLISDRLSLRCQWSSAVKLSDFKPLLAAIHPNDVSGYDLWGFGDLEIVYGDIRSIYTRKVLDHDVISTHDDRVSGQLMLVKNSERWNSAYTQVRGWRDLLTRKTNVGFDERHWSNLFITHRGIGLKERIVNRLRSPRLQHNGLFVERFSTNLPRVPWIDGTRDYPEAWIWRKGVLTAGNAGARRFLYVHVNNWQSDSWRRIGHASPQGLAAIDHCPPGRLTGFKITADGFQPLAEAGDMTAVAAE